MIIATHVTCKPNTPRVGKTEDQTSFHITHSIAVHTTSLDHLRHMNSQRHAPPEMTKGVRTLMQSNTTSAPPGTCSATKCWALLRIASCSSKVLPPGLVTLSGARGVTSGRFFTTVLQMSQMRLPCRTALVWHQSKQWATMVQCDSVLCQRSVHLDMSPLFCTRTVAHCHVSSALAVQGNCVPTLHGKHK